MKARTFNHLDVIGYETDVVLDLQARMSSFFEDEIP